MKRKGDGRTGGVGGFGLSKNFGVVPSK